MVSESEIEPKVIFYKIEATTGWNLLDNTMAVIINLDNQSKLLYSENTIFGFLIKIENVPEAETNNIINY